MRIIEVERKPWKRRNRHHQAEKSECIDEDVMLVDEKGNVVAMQVGVGNAYGAKKRLLTRHLRFGFYWVDSDKRGGSSATRTSGMKYPNRVFGNTAPAPLRRRYAASTSSLYREEPEIAMLLDDFTDINWELFKEHLPEVADFSMKLVSENIHEDWMLRNRPWTSGIINNTAALPYHKDSGNLPESWSAMLAMRKNIDGGGLNLPEYDITLGAPDGSIIFFDGQSNWHGVTPFFFEKKDAYRFTLVWYAKKGFIQCGSREENIRSGQYKATHSVKQQPGQKQTAEEQ